MGNRMIDCEKWLPDFVFNKRYNHYDFVIFTDIFFNEFESILNTFTSYMKKNGDFNISIFIIDNDSSIVVTHSFDIRNITEKQIADSIINYEQDNIASYYGTVSYRIAITTQGDSICVFGERNLDVAIIGSNGGLNYNAALGDDDFAHVVWDIENYIKYYKKFAKKEVFEEFKAKLLRNYSSDVL